MLGTRAYPGLGGTRDPNIPKTQVHPKPGFMRVAGVHGSRVPGARVHPSPLFKPSGAKPTFPRKVSGATQAKVGLGNVDNTSNASKPVSSATQSVLDSQRPWVYDSRLTLYATRADIL